MECVSKMLFCRNIAAIPSLLVEVRTSQPYWGNRKRSPFIR